jgi:tungstate transport system substrate-binding protein
MILAHAPAAEERAVAEGWATGRALVGSNEFWIVGPKEDPAQVATATSAADALRRIARSGAPFVSRGDNSGTHQREMALWSAAGVEPAGDWYRVTHDFMPASLERANAARAYFLTDSSTFVVEGPNVPNLKRLYRGDAALANPYHTLYPADATPGAAVARQFGDFLLSTRGQDLIGKYGRGRHGEPLYRNAANTPD